MSEAETNLLEAISQMDARPQSLTLKNRGEQKNLENRLNMLFGEDLENKGQNEQDALNEAYKTVNEGLTTDTTSGDEFESSLEKKIKGAAVEEQKPAKQVQEGILSSDEENVEEATSQSFMQGAAEVQQQ